MTVLTLLKTQGIFIVEKNKIIDIVSFTRYGQNQSNLGTQNRASGVAKCESSLAKTDRQIAESKKNLE